MTKLIEVNIHKEVRDSKYNSLLAVMSMIIFMGIFAVSILGIIFHLPDRKINNKKSAKHKLKNDKVKSTKKRK